MNGSVLRTAAVVFAAALVVHGADHARRGLDVPSRISIVGGLQFLVGMVAVVLVFKGHRLAPATAVGLGSASALLFSSAHLFPQGSDPYTGAHPASGVTAFSWLTAILEIGAGLAFGVVGALVLHRGRRSRRASRDVLEIGHSLSSPQRGSFVFHEDTATYDDCSG